MEFDWSQIIYEIVVYTNEKINKTRNWICKLYYSFGGFLEMLRKNVHAICLRSAPPLDIS